MDTGLTSDYIAALKEESDVYKDKCIKGLYSSIDDYKHDVGIIKGLELAEQILHDTIQHILERQDLPNED